MKNHTAHEKQKSKLAQNAKLKKIFTRENIGLMLAVVACIIFWLPIYKYQEIHGFWFFKRISQETLDLKPGLISGFTALFINLILYLRGILSYQKKWLDFVSFLVNLTLFATLIEIFISPTFTTASSIPFLHNTLALCGSVACIVILIFGVKEFAKIALLVFFLSNFFMNLKLVNDAMGFAGYINLLIIVTSFYLQQKIDFATLKTEFKYLFGRGKSSTLTQTDIENLIDKKIASSHADIAHTDILQTEEVPTDISAPCKKSKLRTKRIHSKSERAQKQIDYESIPNDKNCAIEDEVVE